VGDLFFVAAIHLDDFGDVFSQPEKGLGGALELDTHVCDKTC
jgi:hypothetical protein